MQDEQILSLFWQRDERAIEETQHKYGSYCRHIAYNILGNKEDAEECVNDAYVRAWNAIPPHEPTRLSTFLGKLTRHAALDRHEARAAAKRGGGQIDVVLEEWQECLPDNCGESMADELELKHALDRFLKALSPTRRCIFIRRYWYVSSIREIAQAYHCGESRIKTMLLRTRRELKDFLQKEGIEI